MFTIIQGDAYDIGIVILAEGAALSTADIRQMRVALGGTVKTYPGGGITYADGVWRYPMTQEESLALRPGAATLTVRMEFSAAPCAPGSPGSPLSPLSPFSPLRAASCASVKSS